MQSNQTKRLTVSGKVPNMIIANWECEHRKSYADILLLNMVDETATVQCAKCGIVWENYAIRENDEILIEDTERGDYPSEEEAAEVMGAKA